ncbi:hypothetical protein FACS1894217_03370 [Clostridia bacterium]|nr:hypothetical protein FACS1894217_03370 [Clostridia bacterium]
MSLFEPLIGIPLIAAVLLLVARPRRVMDWVARIGAGATIAVAIAFVWVNYINYVPTNPLSSFAGFRSAVGVFLSFQDAEWLKYVVLALDLAIAAYLIYAALKNRSVILFVIALSQGVAIALFELLHHSEGSGAERLLYSDKLSQLMILIIGVIGGIICIYTVNYMRDYHRHHTDIPDRTRFFLVVMFVFLAAMFGLVLANELTLLLLCWEITSLASFLMIGYTKTSEAKKNALLAIILNGFGGLCFTAGIIFAGLNGITTLQGLLHIEGFPLPIIDAAVFLIAVAALTKSAQMPFSKWLLGAMVAPTPSSALLHSSTMVKAGVYLLLRVAPLLGDNAAGITVTLVGGVTFFVTAILAVSQKDAKRVLAYSTISNLGLIVACAGLNTPESMWAAVMLIIFHAIAKALLFLTVGSVEHKTGSRDIERMDGLITISKPLTLFLVIGIAGMFVAPFGMLISKWAAMKAFLDAGDVWTTLIVLLIAFGSTITLFFWTKWLGKLIAGARRTDLDKPHKLDGGEKVSLGVLAGMVVLVCLAFPIVSQKFVLPFIDGLGNFFVMSPIDNVANIIIVVMMGLVVVLPFILIPFYKRVLPRRSSAYQSGLQDSRVVELKNYYMESWFGEKIWLNKTIFVCAGALIIGLFVILGGIAL